MKEEAEKKGEKEGESEGEKPRASIFFVAYVRDGVEDKRKRPLTFSFNGGPGSSSVWLHLGLLGPRRVLLDDEGFAYPPPYALVDNNYSLLDHTDLVFIDPVSTGFSRVVPGEKPRQFHGFKRDIESVGDFIRLYTTRYQRWTSPKFLIGESYGTTRAAGLLFGKPTLVVPFFADLPFWGSRVHALRCGPRPIPFRRLTSANLTTAIDRVVNDPGYSHNAKNLGEKLQAEDGVGKAVGYIRAFLETNPLPTGAVL